MQNNYFLLININYNDRSIQSTESCVLENIIGCTKHIKTAIIETYTDLETIARQACMGKRPRSLAPDDCDYLQGDSSNKCDTTEVLNCLVSLHTDFLASEKQQKSICR